MPEWHHSPFPKWLLEPRVIGSEPSGNQTALFAVGWYWNNTVYEAGDDCPRRLVGQRKPNLNDGMPWVIKCYDKGPWFSYRYATRDEIAKYDAIILKEMCITEDLDPVSDGKTLPPLPCWMEDVHVIQHDTAWADNEILAVGKSKRDNGMLWLIRSIRLGPWTDLRSAGPDEIEKYDQAVLKEFCVGSDFHPDAIILPQIAEAITDDAITCAQDRFGIWVAKSSKIPGLSARGATQERAIEAFRHVARLIKGFEDA